MQIASMTDSLIPYVPLSPWSHRVAFERCGYREDVLGPNRRERSGSAQQKLAPPRPEVSGLWWRRASEKRTRRVVLPHEYVDIQYMTPLIGGQAIKPQFKCKSDLCRRAFSSPHQSWSSSLGTLELQSCPSVWIALRSPVPVVLIFSMEPRSLPCTVPVILKCKYATRSSLDYISTFLR
jgi:hypothetical protein